MLIIVSRYNENIEWTKQFPNVLIYNKGDDLAEEYPCIKLPNVGREQHTYFKYIYDNYDNLEDYTVFLQGNPFDHTRDIVNKLHELINNKELDINFMNLSDWVVDCNLPHADIHLREFFIMRNGDMYNDQKTFNDAYVDIYKKIFNESKDHLHFKFGAGAQFIVSKNQILKRPREFYLNLIGLLDYDICPIEAYVVERFTQLIFG